jgi:hypothetical protein
MKSHFGDKMKRLLFALIPAVMLLAACTGAPANTTLEPAVTDLPATIPASTETAVPAIPTDTVPAATEPMPNAKLPASSFESQPYINETAGFALDIPVGWTVNEQVIGSRGSQVQFLSSPELAEAPVVPAGATRVNAMIYQWDPKNDLAAFVANQKSAWEASGFTILEEEQLVLELGLPAVRLSVQTPDAQFTYLITALDEQYLVLSGEGDLALVDEIVRRVRPISR